jgi:hypothetical protein
MTQLRSSVDGSNSTAVSDEARQPLAPWQHRDKRVARGSLGLFLAILAGCSTLGEVMWPGSAPQAESLNFWVPLVVVLGCLFLLSGLFADRFVVLSKIVLIAGGLILLASGVYFGLLSGGGARSIWAVLADVGPGICAIAAGVLIGRARTTTPPDSA